MLHHPGLSRREVVRPDLRIEDVLLISSAVQSYMDLWEEFLQFKNIFWHSWKMSLVSNGRWNETICYHLFWAAASPSRWYDPWKFTQNALKVWGFFSRKQIKPAGWRCFVPVPLQHYMIYPMILMRWEVYREKTDRKMLISCPCVHTQKFLTAFGSVCSLCNHFWLKDGLYFTAVQPDITRLRWTTSGRCLCTSSNVPFSVTEHRTERN